MTHLPSTDRRTLLLTGASRGIGHATVRRFSEAGWQIITTSREAVPAECKRDPNWTHHIPADLADVKQVDRFLAEVSELLGGNGLDALVNNAGVSLKAPTHERLGVLNGDVADWHEVFQLNFFTPLRLVRGLIDPLTRAKGSIVNVTSIAGHAVHPFAGSAYSTSKAALASLTREMAADFGPLGVRVNAISPGEIDTAILSPGTEKLVAEQIPMHRLGTPDEVAKAIYFLVTEASSYVNGAELHINGGQHV